jgi:gas vesicle protein
MAIDDVQERLSGQAEKVGSTVTAAVDELRDRTADLLRVDGGSMFRELHRLGTRIDDAEDRLEAHVDASVAGLDAQLAELRSASKRTTWPRRFVWLTFGAALGALGAYLADPDRGRARRSQLTDQAVARGRSVADDLGGRAKDAARQAKGEVIEQVKDVLPDRPEPDAALLQQRIQSEILGRRTDVADVVLRIDGPGVVALKGTVDSAETERELLEEIAEVDGVSEVTSELTVAGS